MVTEFHEAFDHPIAKAPVQRLDSDLRDLRIELIREEFEEFCTALYGKPVMIFVEPTQPMFVGRSLDIVGAADALADMVYVIAGAALVLGVPLDDVIEEVHAANMRKLGPDGKPIYREDGKVMKPEGWQPPNIAKVLGVSED